MQAQLPALDLYTSASGGDLRLHSPGRLVIYSDGAPTGSITPITVDVSWRCQLKMPGFETAAEVAGEFTTSVPLWTVTSKEYLVPTKAADETAADAITVFGAGIKEVESLRLPFPIVVYTNSSTELAFFVSVKDGKISMYNDIGLGDKVTWKGDSSIVVPAGTVFQVFQVAPPQLKMRGGNGMPQSTLADQLDNCSKPSSRQLRQVMECLSVLIDKLDISCQGESGRTSPSPSLTDSTRLLGY